MIKVGDIAYCGNGDLGLVTEARHHCNSGGEHLVLCRGIHVSTKKFGQPWESKIPIVVGSIYNYLGELEAENEI